MSDAQERARRYLTRLAFAPNLREAQAIATEAQQLPADERRLLVQYLQAGGPVPGVKTADNRQYLQLITTLIQMIGKKP